MEETTTTGRVSFDNNTGTYLIKSPTPFKLGDKEISSYRVFKPSELLELTEELSHSHANGSAGPAEVELLVELSQVVDRDFDK